MRNIGEINCHIHRPAPAVSCFFAPVILTGTKKPRPKRPILIRIMRTSRSGEKDKNRTTHKITAVKAGSHKDDQITLESPDIAEIKTNCRKWLTSPKEFDILVLCYL